MAGEKKLEMIEDDKSTGGGMRKEEKEMKSRIPC